MKPNIENFPTCEKCEYHSELYKPHYGKEYNRVTPLNCQSARLDGKCPKDLWKEDFEKELREIHDDTPTKTIVQKTIRRTIEEILGEA